MKLNIQKLQNRYDREPMMESIYLEDWLEKPITGVDKNNLPMFNAWQNTSKVRDSKNVTELNAIVLDYDSGFSVLDFCMRYYPYQFFLYTTSSHSAERPKFRVILPLSTTIELSDYTADTRKVLQLKFPECDPTAFYTDHYFYPPAKGSGEYQYKVNMGKILNPKIFTAMRLGQTMNAELTKKHYTPKVWTPNIERAEADCQKQMSEIIHRPDGSGRYDSLLKLSYKYQRMGVNKSWIMQCLKGYKNANQIIGR